MRIRALFQTYIMGKDTRCLRLCGVTTAHIRANKIRTLMLDSPSLALFLSKNFEPTFLYLCHLLLVKMVNEWDLFGVHMLLNRW